MKDYFVSYITMRDDGVENIGIGNAFIKSDKTGRHLVMHLVDELEKLDPGAIMINFVDLGKEN